MATTQPNFEILKKAFYIAFVGTEKVTFSIFVQSLSGKLQPSFNSRAAEFRKDFNKWLDGLDIRQAGVLIDILVEHGKDLPGWLKRKDFVIDYNERGALDLLRPVTID